MLIALANEVGERIVAGLLAVEVGPGPHAEARRVQAGVAGLVRMMLDDPRLARVAFVETIRDDSLGRSVLSTFPVWLREILRDCFEENGTDPARQQAFTVALCGAISELLADWVLYPERQPPRRAGRPGGRAHRREVLPYPCPRRRRSEPVWAGMMMRAAASPRGRRSAVTANAVGRPARSHTETAAPDGVRLPERVRNLPHT